MITKQHIPALTALVMAAISLNMSWRQQNSLSPKDLARALNVAVASAKLPKITNNEALQFILEDYNGEIEILAQFANSFGEESVWILTEQIDRTNYRMTLLTPTKKTSSIFSVPPYESTWFVGGPINYDEKLITWSHNKSGSSRSTISFRKTKVTNE